MHNFAKKTQIIPMVILCPIFAFLSQNLNLHESCQRARESGRDICLIQEIFMKTFLPRVKIKQGFKQESACDSPPGDT